MWILPLKAGCIQFSHIMNDFSGVNSELDCMGHQLLYASITSTEWYNSNLLFHKQAEILMVLWTA